MSNLAAWLLEAGAPDEPAVWQADRWWSYAELAQRCRQIAAYVRARTTAGAIVPLVGENSFELVASYLGILYAGAIPAPLAPLGDDALVQVLRETNATLAIISASNAHRIRAAGVEVMALHEEIEEEADAPAPCDPHALAVLLYTSGSTGKPRGVMLSTDNVRFNTDEILALAPLTQDDRALITLPFYYCYGLSVLHTHLRAGGAVVLPPSSNPNELLDVAERTAITSVAGVPSTFHILVTRSTLAERSLPRLRYTMLSGGKANEKLVADLRAALPGTDTYLRYGITEVTAAVSCLAPAQLATKAGSIGTGLPGAPLAVERPDGAPVTPGSEQVGEVVVRGRHVTLGYFQDPDETARSFRDGAFYTGDRARVDADGYVYLVGRDKEFLKIAGHRVSPQEIEESIAQLAEVMEVAVVGVPDATRGEAITAVVVLRPGTKLEMKTLRRHCEARLARWKVPSELRVVEALPKRDNGKLDRRALQASLA